MYNKLTIIIIKQLGYREKPYICNINVLYNDKVLTIDPSEVTFLIEILKYIK